MSSAHKTKHDVRPTLCIENLSFIALSEDVKDQLLNPRQSWIDVLGNWSSQDPSGWNITKNNISYHSQKDIPKETKRIVHALHLDKNSHLVCLGSGLGYLIKYALEIPVASVLLIEPCVETLFYALSRMSLRTYSNKDILNIFVPPVNNYSTETLLPFLKNKNMSCVKVYEHIPSFRCSPEIYQAVKKNWNNILTKRKINQATLSRFQSLWNKNICLNLPHIFQDQGINVFKGMVTKLPIIIAAAGPSLLSHIEELKKYQDQYILLCVDTAYLPLVRNNIFPDMVFCSDPQWVNHYFVLSKYVHRSLWLLDPVSCYAISHWLKQNNALCFWWNSSLPFYKELQNVLGDHGEVAHGGSVSTSAFDMAVQMGTKHIIFVGHDFAFTDKLAHARGSALEERVYLHTDRYNTIEIHNFKQLTALPIMQVKSWSGRLIHTNFKLKIFIDWFENHAKQIHKDIGLWQTDKYGVKLSGFNFLFSWDDIFTEGKKEQFIQMKQKFSLAARESEKDSQSESINQSIKSLLTSLREVYALCQESINNIQSYPVINDTNLLMHLLETNDKKILSHRKAYKVVSAQMQEMIFEVTNTSSSDALKQSLLFYQVMSQEVRKMQFWLEKLYF